MRQLHKVLLLASLFLPLTSMAQDYQNMRNADATLIKIYDSCSEEKPVKCYITYSDYTKKLEVTRAVPLALLQTEISKESTDSDSFKFDLALNLDRDKMQEDVASGKVFSTYGVFTLNNCTRDELVQYSSLPARVNSSGDFNISLMVNIVPANFAIADKSSQWVFKVNDAAINLMDD